MLKMRREPSEKTVKDALKAERQSECEVFKVGSSYLSFQHDGTGSRWKGKPGEVFHRPSPLSEWSLQSGPLEFLHHVILFMGRKTQPSEAQTGRRHITTAAIYE